MIATGSRLGGCTFYVAEAIDRGHHQIIVIPLMLGRLSLGLLASAISLAALPAIAQEGSADDLGVMSISLEDVVRTAFGI